MTTLVKNVDKSRMAKNTLLLYIRMAFMMLVGFYTVRLLLQALGVDDYGLYNVIFGMVSMFTFFSGAMATTVQRFLCHEMGQNNIENTAKVFSVSIFLFLILSGIVLILAETVGLWFVCNKLNVPSGRASVAVIIYQISIFMTLFKILQIPYIAVVTSHEEMGVFAKISILDSFLHLASVAALKFVFYDRLICFSSFYTASNFVILLLYVWYCTKKYSMCRMSFKVHREFLKPMASFFSWSLFGAVANMSKQQGLNLLLNVFCGVVLNATWGIATQVGNAVNQFVASFQQAFNPQILKSYTESDKESFFELLQSCSKYSFMLIWLVALPVLLKTEFFLKLWLGGNLPEGAIVFTQLMVIYILFDAICGPLWVAVQATGNIRRYQVEISCLICTSFIFSLIALKMGAPAYSVAVINTGINALLIIYRLFYLQRAIHFPISRYCLKTLLPIALVSMISVSCGILTHCFSGGKWYSVILYLLLISIVNLTTVFSAGLSGRERNALKMYIRRKLFNG